VVCYNALSFPNHVGSADLSSDEEVAMASSEADLPLRIINSAAPIRICDIGGWTDTWFAGHGKIFNIGVAPFAEAQIAVYPRSARPERVMLYAENYGDRFAIEPGRPTYERHPLLEAAIEEVPPPEEYALEISIHS
jgi:D-glycero-alpha-D-manno-heptose-7-phosphate kinase